MKKSIVLMLLAQQLNNTKKTTRQDIVMMVSDMVEYHIKENAEINGLNTTRTGTGINLGEMMEIIIKAVFNKDTQKSAVNGCDMEYRGKKVEIKFSTSDAYAHPINPREKVDYYLIASYSKANGGLVYKVPFAEKDHIITNAQGRVVCKQANKYIDRRLTEKVFGVVGY